MYYVALLLLLITAFFGARLSIGVFARIQSRWSRRLLFWLLWLPLCLGVSLFLFSFVADDMIFFQSPSYAIGLSAPLLVFNLTLLISALTGFRTDKETQTPRARSWNTPRLGKRLLATATLLLVAGFLFDLQLRHQLSNLKASTLADWESRPVISVADEDNAALVFMELKNSRELLTEWNARLEGIRLREFDSGDESLTTLAECDSVFEIIRRAAQKTAWQLPQEEPQHVLLADDEQGQPFLTAIRLLALNLIMRAEHGGDRDLENDLQALRRAAVHLASEPTVTGLLSGGQSWNMTSGTVERLLQSEALLSVDVLRSLIDEEYNPRLVLPEAFARSRTAFTTLMCDLYLGELNDKQREKLKQPPIGQVPSAIHYLMHMPDRMLKARDDLTALQWRTDVFDSFADRLTDPEATTDALNDEFRMRLPRGTTLNADNRDMLFYAAVAVSDSQQLINLMTAATLYRREHETWPEDISSLTPDFLATVPRSLRDGQPYRLKAVGDGLVIYSAEDARQVESELATSGHIRKDSTRFLFSTAFLGEAYRHVYETGRAGKTESDSIPFPSDDSSPSETTEANADMPTK